MGTPMDLLQRATPEEQLVEVTRGSVDIHTVPELYDPELHYDEGHLNARGAEVFSRLLARRFVESQAPPR